jgi:hypothetical protein
MARQESVGRDMVKVIGFIVGHVSAIVFGLLLMILAMGLGVGLVTLPAALPVGVAGLFLFMWGMIGHDTPTKPVPGPSPQAVPPMKQDTAS